MVLVKALERNKPTLERLFSEIILPVILLMDFAIVLYLVYLLQANTQNVDYRVPLLTGIVVGLTVASGLIQFVINSDVQRRRAAISDLPAIATKLVKLGRELGETVKEEDYIRKCFNNLEAIPADKLEKWNKKFGRKPDRLMLDMINDLELVSIGILSNVYDETIALHYMKGVLTRFRALFAVFITNRQAEQTTFAENFLTLARRWLGAAST